MGTTATFLIQNIVPVIEKYVSEVYIDKRANIAVTTEKITAQDIISNAREVLAVHYRGAKVIFPDVDIIMTTRKNPTTKRV